MEVYYTLLKNILKPKEHLFFFFCFFFHTTLIFSQISGCTDYLAKNYQSDAIINNGSCQFRSISIKPEYSKKLVDTLKETSGLIYFNGLLWTQNDDSDRTIYGLDSLGNIKKRIVLKNVINHDWEEISQDSAYIYIGDFGNNAHGNRIDLTILKINKASLSQNSQDIQKISFSYSDQSNFSKQKSNTTDFDCEAFITTKDSIYLFTKQWKSSKTNIYSLPNQTGVQIAKLKSTLDTKSLVTGATYLEHKKLIALCGYSKKGKSFLYLLYDFKNHDFLSGNKRRINLKLPFHQIEGITTSDGLHYYLTNEALVRKPIINNPQQIHYLDLSSVLGLYLHK